MGIGSKIYKKVADKVLKDTVYDHFKKAGKTAVSKLEEAAAQSPERQELWKILMVINELEHNIGKDPQYVQWLFLDKKSKFVAASWVNKFKLAVCGGDKDGREKTESNDD